MGDLTRACMNRSMHAGSPRKDNAEEVAKRRAAMQRELELRREETRRLQEEKMARAAAQKEERLQKQRELQQKEAQRMQAALQRRNAALAEEKLKKAAVIAKAEQVASRHPIQQKTRSLYAFGSSTPRELGYLTQLSKQQQVYDRKLQPSSGGISSPALNSSRRLSSTSRAVQMTRSMYLPSSDSARRNTGRSVLSVMSRSVYSPQNFPKNLSLLNATPRPTSSKDIIKQHKLGNTIQHHSDDRPSSNGKVSRTVQSKRSKEKISGGELEKSKLTKRESAKKKPLTSRHNIVKQVGKDDVIVENSPRSGISEVKKVTSVRKGLDSPAISTERPTLECPVNEISDMENSFNNKGEQIPPEISNVHDHLGVLLSNEKNEDESDVAEETISLPERPAAAKASTPKFLWYGQTNQVLEDVGDLFLTNQHESAENKEVYESGHVDLKDIDATDCKNSVSGVGVEVENMNFAVNELESSRKTITNENPAVAFETDIINNDSENMIKTVIEAQVDGNSDGFNDIVIQPPNTKESDIVSALANNKEGDNSNSVEVVNNVSAKLTPAEAFEQICEVTLDDESLAVESAQSPSTENNGIDIASDKSCMNTDNENEIIEYSESANSNAKMLYFDSRKKQQNILNAEYLNASNVHLERAVVAASDRNGNVDISDSKENDTDIVNENNASANDMHLNVEMKTKKAEKQIQDESREATEISKYSEAQREREERRARLAAIMRRTRGTPTAVVAPNTQLSSDSGDNKTLVSKSNEIKDNAIGVIDIKDMHRYASEKTASILQRLASSKPQLISSNPHLMSLLQRNGSNQSLADELSAADRQSPPSATPSVAYDSSKETALSGVNSNSFNNETEKQQSVAT